MTVGATIPVLRMSDEAKAREPFVGCPGLGIDAFRAELSARMHRYLRPATGTMPWGMRQLQHRDPFGNRLRISGVTG
jgi:hypothetical protein